MSFGVLLTLFTLVVVVHYPSMTTNHFNTTPPSITQQGFRGLVDADAEHALAMREALAAARAGRLASWATGAPPRRRTAEGALG